MSAARPGAGRNARNGLIRVKAIVSHWKSRIFIRRKGQYVKVVTESEIILIAGPTASGKSALALELAEKLRGVIINADSMQVYRDLRVITARPTPKEEARVPHRLYGRIDAAENYSVGRWRLDAAHRARRAHRATRHLGRHVAARPRGSGDQRGIRASQRPRVLPA